MAGYLSESDFVTVEKGFSTRDLLEELTLEASQATKVRGWLGVGVGAWSLCRPSCLLGKGPKDPQLVTYLVFSPCYLQETAHFIADSWCLCSLP